MSILTRWKTFLLDLADVICRRVYARDLCFLDVNEHKVDTFVDHWVVYFCRADTGIF